MDLIPRDDSVWRVWAKTGQFGGDADEWLALPQHLLDSADVAGRLWDEVVPESVKRFVAHHAGGNDAARALFVFLAGIHDVGKLSPPFRAQGPDWLQDRCHAAGYDLDSREVQFRSKLPHGLAGQLALQSWLKDVHDWAGRVPRSLGCVVGGHHGVFPDRSVFRFRESLEAHMGSPPWAEGRKRLIERLADHSGAAAYLRRWREIPPPDTVQTLITGLVIEADWIASNADLFPYAQSPQDHARRAELGWSMLDLPAAWRAVLDDTDANDLLRRRFAIPAPAVASPLQAEALALAGELTEPGLLIIEAPMGAGKTEAGLLAAERLAATFGQAASIWHCPRLRPAMRSSPGFSNGSSVFRRRSIRGPRCTWHTPKHSSTRSTAE